jgi:hypothetical protein
VEEIGSTSPTLAEVMRSCFLRAGLTRAKGGDDYVLGNPKGWLGTAYHEVLERVATRPRTSEDLGAVVEALWNEAVGAQLERARGHALDARFGEPRAWPGYYLARAAVELRAREMSGNAPLVPGGAQAQPSETIREHRFSSFAGKLVGRPDVVRRNEIVDYKSGSVLEVDETTQCEVVKASFIRQLRIYGFLVHETLGWWPTRGILLPFVGPATSVELNPSECEKEARRAVEILDTFNDAVRARRDPIDLASPSPENCRWCSQKLLCPAFWNACSPKWSVELGGDAVEGVIAEPVRSIHGGAAWAVSVDVELGTRPRGRIEIAPLNASVHPLVTALKAGDRVRLAGLRVRSDGKPVPTMRTVLSRVSDLPEILVGPEKAA